MPLNLVNVSAMSSCHCLCCRLSFQIKEEFRRITAIPLEHRFLSKLDFYTPKLIALMKTKGGCMATKLKPLLSKLSQVCFLSATDPLSVFLSVVVPPAHTRTHAALNGTQLQWPLYSHLITNNLIDL